MNLQIAQEVTEYYIKKYKLKGWKHGWTKKKRAFGTCFYGSKIIGISKPLVERNSIEKVGLVILHEIAHALTPGQKHNNIFKRKLLLIGGDGLTGYDGNKIIKPQGKYLAVCPKCKRIHQRYTKPRGEVCGFCFKRYEPEYELKYRTVDY